MGFMAETVSTSWPICTLTCLPRRSARAVVIAEALSEGRIREWVFADAVTRRSLQPLLVQIDDIALEPSVVGQHLPRSNFRQHNLESSRGRYRPTEYKGGAA